MKDPVELGLPSNDLSGHHLLYNVATASLAVQVWVERLGILWGEIYLRPSGADEYHRVCGKDGSSDESLITSEGPFLFFIRKVGRKVGDQWGFDFGGVVRFDLRSGRHDVLATVSMKANTQWVSDLQWASADGNVVYGCVASAPPNAPFVRYSLSRIEFASGIVEELAPLPAIYV